MKFCFEVFVIDCLYLHSYFEVGEDSYHGRVVRVCHGKTLTMAESYHEERENTFLVFSLFSPNNFI